MLSPIIKMLVVRFQIEFSDKIKSLFIENKIISPVSLIINNKTPLVIINIFFILVFIIKSVNTIVSNICFLKK